VVKLYAGSKGGFVIINPNPFRDKLMITLNSAVAGKITFVLSDINGKKLYREIQRISKGTNVIGINETNKLNEGVYILTVITGQQSQTFKIVKGN
jgi:carbamoylphosphate synthase large subunit